MEGLGPYGVVFVAASLLINSAIGAFFAFRNKRGAAAWRWRKWIEPRHLALLDWSFEVQVQARKQRMELPPLPASLSDLELDEDEEDASVPEWNPLRQRYE